jgi:type I restriction enzyme M protein
VFAHGADGQSLAPPNDYNPNIVRYIDSSNPEDLHDLDAHLHCAIPDRHLDAL